VGTAAALAVKHKCKPRELGEKYICELQQTLLKDDCYIPGIKNEDSMDLALTADISATSHTNGNEPCKVISGVARTVGEESNCWESEGIAKEGEKITLQFKKEHTLSEVRVIFDCNLNQEIMISMTKRVQQKQVKHLPAELVRDYTLKIYRKETVVYEKYVQDNVERLAVHLLPEGIAGDCVEIEFHSTYGCENIRVFEIRIYGM